MKINKYHRDLPLIHAENKSMPEYDEYREHPSPEQLLIRQAIKYLTPKQQMVWELWNYDKLTQDEIAEKLDKDQSTIARTIKACEKRIAKWVKNNMGAYNLLKADYNDNV